MIPSKIDLIILSPHFDDGTFSLGATAAWHAAEGSRVRMVTTFANDPEIDAPRSDWDKRCGFRSAREGVRVRRREDARALATLGVEPTWMPFAPADYRTQLDESAFVEALAEVCGGADLVLLPGCPLQHDDHALLSRIVLDAADRFPRLGLYLEQPYAAWRWPGRKDAPALPPTVVISGQERALDWRLTGAPRGMWARKLRAGFGYGSQLKALGRLVIPRIAAYERRHGGETVALPDYARSASSAGDMRSTTASQVK